MQKPPKYNNRKTGKPWTEKDWTKYRRERLKKHRKTHPHKYEKRILPTRDAIYEGEYEQFPLTAGEDRWENNLGEGCRRILPRYFNWS